MRRGVAISEMAPCSVSKTAINRLCAQAIWFTSRFLEVKKKSNRRIHTAAVNTAYSVNWPQLFYTSGCCWFQTPRNSLASSASTRINASGGRILGSNRRLAVLASAAGHGGYCLYLVSWRPSLSPPQPLVFKSPRSEIRFVSCLMQCRDPEPRIHGIPHLWSRSRFVLHCHCRWEAAAFRGSARSCQRFKLQVADPVL